MQQFDQSEDSIVDPNQRYVLFPIEHDTVWSAYKDQEASFWTAEEMDMTEDVKHYRDRLTEGERLLLQRVLGFFASSDTIVARNIDSNFIGECEKRGWLEAVIAYQFQMMMENIHSEAYSLMIDNLIPDPEQRDELFAAIHNVPSIKAKAEWALRWMGRDHRFELLPEELQNVIRQAASTGEVPNAKLQQWINEKGPTFGERLVAFVCVEAIFFSTSFAIIFYFKKRGLLPGICFTNELISRDEGMHHEFGEHMFWLLNQMAIDGNTGLGEIVPQERIREIVTSCVQLEQAFVRDSLPLALAGINEAKMCRYAEFVADRILVKLGCERIYYANQKNPENPCEWMESIALHHKTNFFERRVAAYQRRGVKKSENANKMNTFRTDADF
jgi:ribonucleoside-diphosphate reductase beta chain